MKPLEQLIADFRNLVYTGIATALLLDAHAKGYEGDVRLVVTMPGYFQRLTPVLYTLQLDCYVLGPARHYKWSGTDPEEVFARATADVEGWVTEAADS